MDSVHQIHPFGYCHLVCGLACTRNKPAAGSVHIAEQDHEVATEAWGMELVGGRLAGLELASCC